MCANRAVCRLAKSGSAIECANRSSMEDLTSAAQSSKRQGRDRDVRNCGKLGAVILRPASATIDFQSALHGGFALRIPKPCAGHGFKMLCADFAMSETKKIMTSLDGTFAV